MNHQNALNDAMGVLFAINDRKPHFIARADVFDIHPLFKKFLLWIGLLPAFRMQYKGGTALEKNASTFELSEQSLIDGDVVLIFPESGHQTIHWLGYFSLGYTRMAFQAAEKTNFEKEIFILPAINHYSKYNGLKNDMLVRFGKPVSIKPWYELHKTKPRTAERLLGKRKAQRLDEVQHGARGNAGPADVAGVRRDLRLVKYDMHYPKFSNVNTGSGFGRSRCRSSSS